MIFCTYFDSAYLPRAKVCLKTLFQHGRSIRVYALALDQAALDAAAGLPGVVPVSLAEIEAYRPSLLGVKAKRQKKEYYATITPVLPQLVFDVEDPNEVYYTDADMAFWGPVEEIAEEMGRASLLVTPHENPAAHVAGIFNVGILGYRNDAHGEQFLKWWEERCLEWCEWRATRDGKCADQGHLSILQGQPEKFKNVRICQHPGINMGPWNLAMHAFEMRGGRPLVDGRSLVSYHFHGFKSENGKGVNNTGWDVSDEALDSLYQPYDSMLRQAIDGGL